MNKPPKQANAKIIKLYTNQVTEQQLREWDHSIQESITASYITGLQQIETMISDHQHAGRDVKRSKIRGC